MSLQEDALKALLADTTLVKKRNELIEKKIDLDHNRVTREHDQMVQDQKDLERLQTMNIGVYSAEDTDALIQKNDDYIEAAKQNMCFINSAFDGVIPFFRKNIILIGASTGSGKSTLVANVVRTLIAQKRSDGTACRALILTNEEAREDCFNRVTALIKGWSYTDHDKITDEQRNTYNEYIRLMTRTGLVTVIDDNHNGINGCTTTIEGIEGILENVVRNKTDFDCILIDYYQNVKASKKDATMGEYEVQAALAALLDRYKNILPCPIVLLAQVNKETEKDNKPFELRIKGRKVITDPCTLIMEIQREKEYSRTKWIVHKSRFTSAVGAEFYTGFEKGQFVPYTDEFMAAAAKRRDAFMGEKIAEATGKEKK